MMCDDTVRAPTLRLIDNRLRTVPQLTQPIERFALRALLAALSADVDAERAAAAVTL